MENIKALEVIGTIRVPYSKIVGDQECVAEEEFTLLVDRKTGEYYIHHILDIWSLTPTVGDLYKLVLLRKAVELEKIAKITA